MNNLDLYQKRANEIIGPRTSEEEAYDNEVVRSFKKYGKIRKALNTANKRYPKEALKYSELDVPDLQNRYEYMVKHYEIINRLSDG